MATTTTLHFDDVDMRAAADLLQAMGLTLDEYLYMALKQLIIQRRVPFDVRSFKTAEEAMGWLDDDRS